MATKYTTHLRIIAPANKGKYEDSVAQFISQEFEKACPDVGPDNCSIPLNLDGDSKLPTHFMFSAPIKPEHLEAIEGRGLHKLEGVKYWRSDRAGDLKEKHDNPTPAKATVTDDLVMLEANVKLRKETVEVEKALEEVSVKKI